MLGNGHLVSHSICELSIISRYYVNILSFSAGRDCRRFRLWPATSSGYLVSVHSRCSKKAMALPRSPHKSETHYLTLITLRLCTTWRALFKLLQSSNHGISPLLNRILSVSDDMAPTPCKLYSMRHHIKVPKYIYKIALSFLSHRPLGNGILSDSQWRSWPPYLENTGSVCAGLSRVLQVTAPLFRLGVYMWGCYNGWPCLRRDCRVSIAVVV